MKFSAPNNALIIIADGEQALYFRNSGTGELKLQHEGNLSLKDNNRGAAPVPVETDPKEQKEATFAKHLADDLYKKVYGSNIPAVVLVADPQTLGQIRSSLHQEVTKRLSGELAKNLTHLPVSEIESILSAA